MGQAIALEHLNDSNKLGLKLFFLAIKVEAHVALVTFQFGLVDEVLKELDRLPVLPDDLFKGYRDEVALCLQKLTRFHLKVEIKILEHVLGDATLLNKLQHELPISCQLKLSV